MRIVTLHTIGLREGLILMRLLQIGILGVVTIEAESRSRFGEVEAVLGGGFQAGFMG